MAAAISFALTEAPLFSPVTINASGLGLNTAYAATVTTPDGETTPIEFTSDGSGNASLQFTPTLEGVHTLTCDPLVEVISATSSNTMTGV